jgi:predicted metal-binding membrane protein
MGCMAHGHTTRALLSWVLLGTDGVALCWGVMNILWIAALATLVAVEKLAPRGVQVARVLGCFMIGAGVLRLASPSLS